MKLFVSKLKPNPFRRIDAYPIDRVKVDSLKAAYTGEIGPPVPDKIGH